MHTTSGLLRVWLLALDGRSAKLAVGLPSGPLLSGLSRAPSLDNKFDQDDPNSWKSNDSKKAWYSFYYFYFASSDVFGVFKYPPPLPWIPAGMCKKII